MPSEGLDVFDFDGTLIRVNSFREITARFLAELLRRGRALTLLKVGGLSVLRKCGLMSHLPYKRRIAELFERTLSERQKRRICQAVFDRYVNRMVYDEFLRRDRCLISTSAPYAYVSRISFGKQVPTLCALEPCGRLPDDSNFGQGKVDNLRAYLKTEDICLDTFFTDNPSDDGPLVNLSKEAFRVDDGRMTRLK